MLKGKKIAVSTGFDGGRYEVVRKTAVYGMLEPAEFCKLQQMPGIVRKHLMFPGCVVGIYLVHEQSPDLIYEVEYRYVACVMPAAVHNRFEGR